MSAATDRTRTDNHSWYLTGDNRIAITGGDQCLDMGDNGVQTYQCTPYNDNQGELTNVQPMEAHSSLVCRGRDRTASVRVPVADSLGLCFGYPLAFGVRLL